MSSIPPSSLAFLKQLAKNNKRDWFKPRKEKFEADCRDPVLAWFEQLKPKLETMAPMLFVDASPTGGSLRRIYRDTRFGKNKKPYKTNLALLMPHLGVEGNIDAPCFYLQIEPGNSFFAAGLYGPGTADKTKVRRAIDADPAGWKKATRSAAFKKHLAMVDGSLVRTPKGFDDDHPLIEDLKRQRWAAASKTFADDEVTDTSFGKTILAHTKAAAPLTGFVSRALGLHW